MEGIFGTREEELPKFKDYFLNSMKTLNSTMDKSKVDATKRHKDLDNRVVKLEIFSSTTAPQLIENTS